MVESNFGFIMLRSVQSQAHSQMWIHCYDCIRKFYKEPIIIIDDNSNQALIADIQLIDTRIIQSEYPKSRELLPYYYFHKLKPFDKAVILHDSMFFQEKIDFTNIDNIKFLWHIDKHDWNDVILEKQYLNILDNNTGLNKFYDDKQWYGCFGVASVINYELIHYLQQKYQIFKLLNYVKDRFTAMPLERIIGLLCFFENKISFNDCSINGSIVDHPYFPWLTFHGYQNSKLNGKMIKCWSGR